MATKQQVEDFWSLWNRIAILFEREIKPDSMKVEFCAFQSVLIMGRMLVRKVIVGFFYVD
jgi:hypothetical protein